MMTRRSASSILMLPNCTDVGAAQGLGLSGLGDRERQTATSDEGLPLPHHEAPAILLAMPAAMPAAIPEVTIYADAAASPNPGSGGYGVVLIRNGRRQELSGGFRKTTNNRMEILGAIVGLRALGGENAAVTIHSDSRYLVDMFRGVSMLFRQCGIRLHWEGVVGRAQVEVGFHSLRFAFVSICRRANAPLAVVERLVGHSSPEMTRHYTDIGHAETVAAIASLPSFMDGVPRTASPKAAHAADVTSLGDEEFRRLAEAVAAEAARRGSCRFEKADSVKRLPLPSPFAASPQTA